MKNNKHDHKLTKYLKATIFSIVMLAPFIAVGVKCLYVINNKNAKDSYTGKYAYHTDIDIATFINTNNIQLTEETNNKYYENNNFITQVTYQNNNVTYNRFGYYGFNVTDLVINGTLYECQSFCFHTATPYDTGITISMFNVQIDTNTQILTTNYYQSNIYYVKNDITIERINYLNNIDLNNISIKFNNISNKIYAYNTQKTFLETLTFHTYIIDTNLSNVFYSSINELDKASIFTWTTNTAIYSAVLNTTEGLGIASPPLAVLITYWSIITAIYIIFDIVIEMFIFLTHWANDKMA